MSLSLSFFFDFKNWAVILNRYKVSERIMNDSYTELSRGYRYID